MSNRLFYAIKVSGRILPGRYASTGEAEVRRQAVLTENAGAVPCVVIVNEAGEEMIMLDGSAPSNQSPLFG